MKLTSFMTSLFYSLMCDHVLKVRAIEATLRAYRVHKVCIFMKYNQNLASAKSVITTQTVMGKTKRPRAVVTGGLMPLA